MAEALHSVHGRCPRCEQVLSVPAGHLQGYFRCARCQYRAPGGTLVEAALRSPPRGATGNGPDLPRFDEIEDEQHTELFDPDAPDAASEVPLSAIPETAADLGRFDSGEPDADDQHTRVHLGGSLPGAPEPPSVPAPRHDATLMGMPSAAGPGALLGGAGLQRFDAVEEDADDQATRMHLVDEPYDDPVSSVPLKDRTLMGVAPAANPPGVAGFGSPPFGSPPFGSPPFSSPPFGSGSMFGGPGPVAPTSGSPMPQSPMPQSPMPQSPMPQSPPQAGVAHLQRFGDEGEDSEEQHTRLHVPISYEDDEPVPDLRAPVSPLASPSQIAALQVQARPSTATQLGMDTLHLSRFIDDWLHGQRTVLLVTLAMLCAAIAPALDRITGNAHQAATVISANLVLFFLWTLAFAWLGKLRNDQFVWDYRVAFSRLGTHAKLLSADLSRIGTLPAPLRLRAVGELFSTLGLVGLWACCTLTVSQLVWNVPASVPELFFGRFSSSVLIVLAAVCRSRAATTGIHLYGNWEVSAPAVSRFPAIIDLSLPLNVHPELRVTPLYELLEVLSRWEPQSFPNRDSYQSVLQRHLLRNMAWAQVERDHWLGAERTDGVAHVMVNDSLLIEVVCGFDDAAADRISARMRRLARTWRGKPALVVIFDASRASVLQSSATPPLESLHRAYPMLTVRMPSANPLYY